MGFRAISYVIYFFYGNYKFYSPNFDKTKKTLKNITTIIMHYTGMQSERESLKG